MSDLNTPSIDGEEFDPFSPDAPIDHYLSISKNPRVKDMTTEQLNQLITRLRAIATSPQTMTAVLQNDAKRRRPMTEAQRKRKELLDSL